MEKESIDLQQKYYLLRKEFLDLQGKYKQLQHDYSENTIIQSMNDMKVKYDDLIASTISIYRYEFLEKKHTSLKQKASAVAVLVNYLTNALDQYENRFGHGNEIDQKKLQLQLLVIKDLLEDSLT